MTSRRSDTWVTNKDAVAENPLPIGKPQPYRHIRKHAPKIQTKYVLVAQVLVLDVKEFVLSLGKRFPG